MRRLRIHLRAAFAALAMAAFAAPCFGQSGDKPPAIIGYQYVTASTQNLSECVAHTIKATGLEKPSFADYNQIWLLCGNQLYDVDYLVDFDIRREKFIRQELDERVILWMVVAITMSGVALAGLQLSASYRLAVLGRGQLAETNEFSAEQGKLSVRSSVTGLMILVVSLLFFIVYVKFIYNAPEVKEQEQAPSNLHAVTLPPQSMAGPTGNAGLMPPPTVEAGAPSLKVVKAFANVAAAPGLKRVPVGK